VKEGADPKHVLSSAEGGLQAGRSRHPDVRLQEPRGHRPGSRVDPHPGCQRRQCPWRCPIAQPDRHRQHRLM